MTKTDIIRHFKTQREAAKALKISYEAVRRWPNNGVPPLRQIQLERMTQGKLKADSRIYA